MSILGNRVLRTEDPRLLTAGGVYVADLHDPRLDGAVFATFVRATVAHADIGGIDVSEALAAPGVVAVVTGADVDLAPIPGMVRPEMARHYVARDRVRFVGEPVAVVLSETATEGADAAELVVVDYDPLPAVTDPIEALDGDAVLFPEVGTNLIGGFGHAGPEGEGPEACEVVVRQRIVNQRLAACPLEVRATASAWVDGRLVMWSSTQSAHGLKTSLVGLYDLGPEDVLVIAPDVGGGFGAKGSGSPEDLLIPWLARHCGRPVRWVETRTENMLAMVQGRGQVQDVAIGGTPDGKIEAYHLAITQDAGA